MTKITFRTTRSTSRQLAVWQDTAVGEEANTPLTAEQARQWRERHPQVPMARVLTVQALVGAVAAVATWALTGKPLAGWSAAYGVLVAVVPAALAAKGMARWAAPGFPPGAALAGFLVWEAVKLILAVGMLIAAPKILTVPNWPALLAGLFVAFIVYGVALAVKPKQRPQTKTDLAR